MVQPPPVRATRPPQSMRARRNANVAERYVMMRRQAHAAKHAQGLATWNGDEESYYANFRQRVQMDSQWFREQVAQINADERMSYTEKEEAKIKASQRVTRPAWDGLYPGQDCNQHDCKHKECAFIRDYGDPREVDRVRLDNVLNELNAVDDFGKPVWSPAPYGDAAQVERPKSDWEATEYQHLVTPMDGSVPLFPKVEMEPYIAMKNEAEQASTDAAPPEASAQPIVSDPWVEREITQNTPPVEELPSLTCKWCGKIASLKREHGELKRQLRYARVSRQKHEDQCEKNPDPTRGFAKRKKE